MAEGQQELGNVWLTVREFYVCDCSVSTWGGCHTQSAPAGLLLVFLRAAFWKYSPWTLRQRHFPSCGCILLCHILTSAEVKQGNVGIPWYSHTELKVSWNTRRYNNKDSPQLLPISLLANSSDPLLRAVVTEVTDSWAALNCMSHISVSTATLIIGSGTWSWCYDKPHNTADFLSL